MPGLDERMGAFTIPNASLDRALIVIRTWYIANLGIRGARWHRGAAYLHLGRAGP